MPPAVIRRTWPAPSRAPTGLAALCLVLLVGIVTLYLWRNGETPRPSDAPSDEPDAVSIANSTVAGSLAAGAPDAAAGVQFDCLALLGEVSGSLALASERKRIGIRSFLGTLEDQGFSSLGQRLVADLAGVEAGDLTPDMRWDAFGVNEPHVAAYSLPSTGGQDPPLSTTQRNRLHEVLQSPGIEPLIDEFRADPSVLRRTWLPDDPFQFDQATTVLGHAIRVRGSDLYRALDNHPSKGGFRAARTRRRCRTWRWRHRPCCDSGSQQGRSDCHLARPQDNPGQHPLHWSRRLPPIRMHCNCSWRTGATRPLDAVPC